MRAVRLLQTRSPLEDRVVGDPSAGPGELLVAIRAAGICHSDGIYRAGRGNVSLPLTLGHEIAGVVVTAGDGVHDFTAGDRVAVHYLLACGTCDGCVAHGEQFCLNGAMFGKERDGGFAERIVIPARNAIAVPANVPLEHAAVMMCSTATAYHALRLAQVQPGESVLILGFGGLGVSAVQLVQLMGAERVYAADVVPEKLCAARALGAIGVDATGDLPPARVALDFAGHPPTTLRALRALEPGGRLVVVAINLRELSLDPYRDILTRERRIIGCSDHTRRELEELMSLASAGRIDLSVAITRTVGRTASDINAVLDEMDEGRSAHLRTVTIAT